MDYECPKCGDTVISYPFGGKWWREDYCDCHCENCGTERLLKERPWE